MLADPKVHGPAFVDWMAISHEHADAVDAIMQEMCALVRPHFDSPADAAASALGAELLWFEWWAVARKH